MMGKGKIFCHGLWFYVLQILFGGGLLVCEQLLTKAKPARSCKANVSLMMTVTLPAKFNKSRYTLYSLHSRSVGKLLNPFYCCMKLRNP